MGIARFQCYFGKHIRSRGRARRTTFGWHSYCRRCGIEMVKEDGGDWCIVDASEPETADTGAVVGGPIDVSESLMADEATAPKPASRSRFSRFLRRKT